MCIQFLRAGGLKHHDVGAHTITANPQAFGAWNRWISYRVKFCPGWSWFKFDIDGWLSSKDVRCMNMNDRGMYTHLLIIQARDGKLDADLRIL